jgi:eukaryotic-like serine/threonine-protein kinase
VAKLMTPIGDLPLTSTVEGTIVGTPAYMAPEQANGLGADARTDQYALGCVLFEMLAGHPPFSGASFGQLVAQVLTEPAPPLPARTPASERIPAALRAVVLRCLAKDPVDRFRDMAALEEALCAALLQQVERRRGGALLATGIVAACLLAVAFTALRVRHILSSPQAVAVAVAPAAGAPAPEPAVLPPLPVPEATTAPKALLRLNVLSQPNGARVERVDSGEVLGTTPLVTRVPEAPGNLVLRLSAPGHQSVLRSVPGQGEVQLEVRLPPRAKRAEVPATARPTGHSKNPDPFKL